MGMIELLPRPLYFNQVLPLGVFISLLMQNIRKGVLLVLEYLVATVNDGILVDVGLFVLSDFFEGGGKRLCPSGVGVFDGLVIILPGDLKGSKGRSDHTVNY